MFQPGQLLHEGQVRVDGPVLGRGTFGVVIAASIAGNPRCLVALKIVETEYDAPAITREALALSRLMGTDHHGRQCIGKISTIFQHEGFSVFILERLFDSLDDMAARYYPAVGFHIGDIKTIARSVLCALECCHSLGIAHTDIKPSNVMISHRAILRKATSLDARSTSWAEAPFGVEYLSCFLVRQDEVKLIDFGCSYDISGGACNKFPVGTLPYRSPEAILYIPWTEKVDLWSLGCLLMELFSGFQLFPIREERDTPYHIFLIERMVGRLPASMRNLKRGRWYIGNAPNRGTPLQLQVELGDEETLSAMILGMLEIDPELRLTASQCLALRFNQ